MSQPDQSRGTDAAPEVIWVGPFTVGAMLKHCLDDDLPKPPASKSAYLVSEHRWKGKPTAACRPLYVGGTTGKSERLRTRIGDLVADLFGFFTDTTGHHSGGYKLHCYCREHKISPLALFIGWVLDAPCHRCLEVELHKVYKSSLLNNHRLEAGGFDSRLKARPSADPRGAPYVSQ